MKVEVNVSGDLSGQMQKVAKGTAQKIQRGVQQSGTEAQRLAMIYAPVDTGFLKRHILLYIENGGYQARYVSEAEYAVYQELGTRFQSGTPHVTPAFERIKPVFIRRMGEVFE